MQCVSCASPFDPAPRLDATFSETGTMSPLAGVPEVMDASENGDYVFFDTPSALVPQDIDGETAPEGARSEHSSPAYSVSSDVYEWRKDGVGGCSRVEGCVALISSGAGGYKVELLGTTRSGGDVFFATHESLVAQDMDTSGDVYDARIDGGFPAAAPGPVECEAGACQSPGGAPLDTTPASLSFAGPGNPVVSVAAPAGKPAVKAKQKKAASCAKGKTRTRGKCVKRKTKAKQVEGEASWRGRRSSAVKRDLGGRR